jgi:hypothetical protein
METRTLLHDEYLIVPEDWNIEWCDVDEVQPEDVDGRVVYPITEADFNKLKAGEFVLGYNKE